MALSPQGLCWLVLLGASLHAQATNVYRSVGPGGTVTYSDRAPDSLAQPQPLRAPEPGTAVDLPFALRQAVQRFPVVIYTARNCAACQDLRELLQTRGVPFNEKTIGSAEDYAAFMRLSGKDSVPFGTIGRQAVHGFSASEWAQYLDAAGYPAHSQLPSHYKLRPAQPLVASPAAGSSAASAAGTAGSPSAPRLPSVTPMPPPSAAEAPGLAPGNPAGIRF